MLLPQRADSTLKVTNVDAKSQVSKGRMSSNSKTLGQGMKPEEIFQRELEATKTEFSDVKNEQ